MTVIAFDGRILAADKQGTFGNVARVVTKIHRVPQGIMGFSGSLQAGVAMVQWLREGANHERWPAVQASEDDCRVLLIDWHGKIWLYEDFPHAMLLESRFEALGSGRDFALAAMHMGANAVGAVRVACDLAIDCGSGLDAISLDEAYAQHLRETQRVAA